MGEYVRVPRAELVRLQENMDPHRGAVAWGIVCDLLAKPAEQHQGEPVFWRYRSGPNRAWTETTDRGQVESAARAGWIVQALYTHGDTSETEELRKENASLRAGWYKDESDNSRYWPEQLQEAKSELAERDALLQDLLDYDISKNARRRIEEALSASIEPSASTEREAWALQEEKRLGIERLPVEPSAPVERDERAEFEKACSDGRIADIGIKTGVVYESVKANDIWIGWLARAALERKP